MRRFSVVREVELSPSYVWDRLTDWPAHSAGVPFTTVHPVGSTGMVAVTRLGPIVVRDPMELTVFDPPTRFVAVKTGSIVKGEIDVSIAPTGPGTRITWDASIAVAGVPALADPVVVAASKAMYGRLIDQLLKQA